MTQVRRQGGVEGDSFHLLGPALSWGGVVVLVDGRRRHRVAESEPPPDAHRCRERVRTRFCWRKRRCRGDVLGDGESCTVALNDCVRSSAPAVVEGSSMFWAAPDGGHTRYGAGEFGCGHQVSEFRTEVHGRRVVVEFKDT